MSYKTRVVATITEPWNFPDENEGHLEISGTVLSRLPSGQWLVKLDRPVRYEEKVWHYAIPFTRYVGQSYFDDPDNTDVTANIVLGNNRRKLLLQSKTWEARKFAEGLPWLIGDLHILGKERARVPFRRTAENRKKDD